MGAGLGGLAAAAVLARAGVRVAVFDQHDEAGGFATQFRRDGYAFEVSLHELDAVGPGEANRPLLEALGIADRLELVQSPWLRREVWPAEGDDVWLPKDLEASIQVLAARFPGCEEGVRGLFALAREVHTRCYDAIENGQLRLDRGSRALHALITRTAGEVLAERVDHPGARRILSTLAAYQGLWPRELGAVPYLVMLWGYHGIGAWVPRGGSRALTDALVHVVQAHGGAVQLRSPVAAIRCVRGRARGITLADGTEVPARAVVSNASPLTTFGTLVPDAEVPARYLARLRAMRVSTSLYCVYAGLDVPVEALAPMAYETYVHAPELGYPISVTAPTVLDPAWAPPGGGCAALSSDRDLADVLQTHDKRAIGQAIVASVERHLLPGLTDHLAVTEIAHPGTFERFTTHPRGAIFGFAATPEQSGPRRLSGVTPIHDLHLASGWVFPGAGQTAAMQSGWLAATEILRRLR